ncbi:type VI secretion system tube protein Hcp [Solirubrobacter soli]|uniref:type VI secretion system tube protein Hcp n=1 Tax=Solirubrobacter soli TaxID=363832 RepID=UPI0003FC8992|nr:type VI secretion system tube protein Hcp [Solirubrobacter soli]
MTKRLMAGIVLPAVLAVGAASAIAANDSDVIRACAAKNGKTLHLAGANGKCAKGETALTWNQKGPAGAPGAAGPAGPQGPAGANAAAPENVVGGDPLAGGQATMSASIDGIGDISVKAFGFGGKNTPGSAGGGGGAGKVAFHDLTFAKLYDATSPKLFQRLATGEHIKQVTFNLHGDDDLTYKLSDVVVTSYEQGGTKERPLLERVELNFSKVEISFTPAGGAPITAGFDVKANKSV